MFYINLDQFIFLFILVVLCPSSSSFTNYTSPLSLIVHLSHPIQPLIDRLSNLSVNLAFVSVNNSDIDNATEIGILEYNLNVIDVDQSIIINSWSPSARSFLNSVSNLTDSTGYVLIDICHQHGPNKSVFHLVKHNLFGLYVMPMANKSLSNFLYYFNNTMIPDHSYFLTLNDTNPNLYWNLTQTLCDIDLAGNRMSNCSNTTGVCEDNTAKTSDHEMNKTSGASTGSISMQSQRSSGSSIAVVMAVVLLAAVAICVVYRKRIRTFVMEKMQGKETDMQMTSVRYGTLGNTDEHPYDNRGL